MLRKIVLALCTAAALNLSAGLTGASAAPHGGGGHPGGGHPGGGGGPHFSGGHPGFRGGPVRGYGGYGGGYGGGYAAVPYGYGYDPYGYDPYGYVPYGYAPYGYDEGYDAGPAIAAGIIGTIGAIIASHGGYHHGCGWHNHHRVCR